MNFVEPLASHTPYMVAPGNHEGKNTCIKQLKFQPLMAKILYHSPTCLLCQITSCGTRLTMAQCTS